ncbi:RRP1B protein, partial [Rostratula benghalensis]|nr:RRP1B protein [Rostratula benghalensis]
MAPAALQPPEVQFAQRLAANEKRIRDRALKKLRGYISVRTQRPAGGFSQEELLKVWKGLFYCMWMQDKPLLQEELADNISQLIHVFQNTEARNLFIQTFWQTMNREWNGIDNLRLDKYYMLMRRILRQSFEVLKRNEWDESLMELLLPLLIKEVMDPESNAPTGIKLHFIDIYLDELAKVGAKELTADQNLKFIEPFCKIAATSKERGMLHAVATGIFELIVDQSPYAIEDLMKELDSNNNEEDAPEEDKQENEEVLNTTADRCLSRKSAQTSEKTEGVDENADDGIGTVLQFDYKAVADKLFELASKKNTPSRNRKRLYKLVKNFQISYPSSSTGIFPQDIPEDVSTDEDDDEFSRGRRKKKAVKPWETTKLEKEKEDEQEMSSAKEASVSQKKRKKRKRGSPSADSGTADGNCEEGIAETSGSNVSSQGKVPENNKERKKKKLQVNEANETPNVVTNTGENHSISAQNSQKDAEESKKSQLKKMNLKGQNVPVKPPCRNGPANASKAEDVSPSVTALTPKVVKKKQKAGVVLVNGDTHLQQMDVKSKKGTLSEDGCSESAPSRKVKLKTKTKVVGLEGMKVSSQKAPTLKKKRKVKEVLNSVETNGVLETACKKSRKADSSAAISPLKKKKGKPGSDFVKFEKPTVPKGVFFRKARSTISSTRASMQLNKLQPSSSKKVTFGLNKNMTAEFKKTDKSILVSPEGPSRVAFNPEQKPRHGVLKSPTGTPAGQPQKKKPFTIAAKKRPTGVDLF